MALLVKDNSAPAWHSQDAREFKKLKPSVPEIPKKDKDAEIREANSRCIAMDSHPDFSKKDAEIREANSGCFAMDSYPDFSKKDGETPEAYSTHIVDLLEKLKKLKHSKKAMISQQDILNEEEEAIKIGRTEFLLKHFELSRKKQIARRMEANSRCSAKNSHPDIFKKGAARSRWIDVMNSYPHLFEKVSEEESRARCLAILQDQSETLEEKHHLADLLDVTRF